MDNNSKSGLDINVKSFITAILMLAVLMVLTYVLTFVIPGGSYHRQIVDGQEVVLPDTFTYIPGGIPFWKWLLSPFLVLTAEGNVTVIAILIFLLIIGGTFHSLDKSGLLRYMLQKIVSRFQNQKYRLLALITLFFMTLGAFVGSFEECVPLVPIAIALACSMGWDALVGLGMSLLAIGCGFATGVCNPFTVGVAQELAGLPMFSGISFRLLSFVLIYGCMMLFLIHYAKRIEASPDKAVFGTGANNYASAQDVSFEKNIGMERALWLFAGILTFGIVLILSSSFIPFLQDIIMPLIALIFLAAGISSSLACGMKGRLLGRYFRDGAVSILPAVILILMASSVRYTMTEARILDTILYQSTAWIDSLPNSVAILFIYLIVMVMDFFISSGSAKAFLLMPLIVPMADLSGISRQLSILAFAFGDGFSNIFFFTNPVLLISLGLAGISYGKWMKWSAKFQLVILLVTTAVLLLANAAGY